MYVVCCELHCRKTILALYLNDFDEKQLNEDVQEGPDSALINKNLFL